MMSRGIGEERWKLLDSSNHNQTCATVVTHTLAEKVIGRDAEIAELQTQVNALVASHVGCIRTVMLMGGVKSLERFWQEYKVVGDTVHQLGGVPKMLQVVPLTLSNQVS